jgi:hypothetical protein
MAREPTLVSKDKNDSPAMNLSAEQVTYTPGPGDPNEVVWMGYKFKAHVPHDVRKAELIEKAKTNKFFHVGPFDPAQHAYKETVVEPRTAEAYRGWAVNWAKAIWLDPNGTLDDLCERWANEARMRNKLEVGFDDYSYMSHLFQPMVDEMLRREDEPRKKRDELLRNRELDGLILQIAGVGQAA